MKILKLTKQIIHNIIQKYLEIDVIKTGTRYSEKLIREHLGENLIGVEIGILEGRNARKMLTNLPIKKLYLIDPYLIYPEYTARETRLAEKRMKRILNNFWDRIIFIKDKSENCKNMIPDSLDFVYIDGSHTYENVKKDIENYYPKVRKGGIICGHDIIKPDVAKAVGELSLKIKQPILIGIDDWAIIKK